ncbi:MAG TPA: FtsX-like permease family protein [Phycisphaerae bacterium]|jgi:hypothetical protein
MKPVVPKQVQLPLARAFEIAVKSLRVRLGRSLLTLITIGMAIAFLTFIWMTRVADPILAARAGGVEAELGSVAGGTAAQGAGGTARTIWLLSLSMLVCLVGISNAMLMSVMERFREIGTMKCLGALDSFILKLFLIESVLMGLAGAAAGVLIGTSLALLQLWRRFGSGSWSTMPWGNIWLIAAASVVIGLLITATAALYPALRAAKMDPIAAMRVEV